MVHEATGLQTILALVAAGLGVAFVAGSVAASLTRVGVVFRPLAGPAPRLVTGPARLAGSDHPGARLLRQVVVEIGATDKSDQSQVSELILDGSRARP